MADDDQAILNFMVEVYVPGHERTIAFPWALTVDRSVTDVREVMNFAHAQMQGLLGSQHRMTIVDERYNHHILQLDKCAVLSILAPDADSLPWAETGEDDG